MKRLLRLAVVFGVVFCSLPALAKTPKPQAKTPIATDDSDQEPPLVLKVYDVSDVQLAVAGPSRGIDDMDGTGSAYGESIFPQPGSLPGPAPYNPRALTNGSNMELPDARDPIEQLRNAINALILGPDSVDNNGRSDIHVLGEVLAVSATEKNHRQIAAFLDALRQHAATRKVVAVEVHWLWLTEEQLKSLVPSNAGGDRATVCLNVDETTWHRLAKERERRQRIAARIPCGGDLHEWANRIGQRGLAETVHLDDDPGRRRRRALGCFAGQSSLNFATTIVPVYRLSTCHNHYSRRRVCSVEADRLWRPRAAGHPPAQSRCKSPTDSACRSPTE